MKRYTKALIFITSLLLIILFINPISVKGITLSSINYTFANDNLYNSTNINFNESNIVNVRNNSEYTNTYPATYSFTNEIDGTEGLDIEFIDVDNSAINTGSIIIPVLNNHEKVLKCYDNNITENFSINNNFTTSQTFGTIEFWIQIDDVNTESYIRFRNDDQMILRLRTNAGNYEIQDNIGFQILNSISNDVWFHIRLDFECTNGGYKGLSQYEMEIYQNGVSEGVFDFVSNEPSINNLQFHTNTADTMITYYDAISYSWSILDDYTELLDFTDDTIGQEPIGWISANEGSCTTVIKDILDNRNNSLELFDEGGGGTEANIRKDLDNVMLYSIEMDIAKSKTNEGIIYYYFMENDVNIVELALIDDDLKYFDSGYQTIDTSVFTANIFFILRVEFDFDSDTIDVYINGILEGNDLPFKNNGNSEVDELIFFTDDTEISTFFGYIDNIYIDSFTYSIGSNIFPTIETSNIYEVDKFEFDMVSANTLYDIGTDNPSGWTDIEVAANDFTNIGQDNTDISGGSRTNHRVVEIEANGNADFTSGLEKEFDILDGIINVSMNFNFSIVDNDLGTFNLSIYSYNLDLQTRITLDFPNPSIFGANVKYYNGSNYITLLDSVDSTFASLQEHTYSIYIDSFVVFKATTNGSLGFHSYNYTFPLINSSNSGLGKIRMISYPADAPDEDTFMYIKSIGVYNNSNSLSDDFGYLPLRLKDSSTFWLYQAHNLFRINAIGNMAINTASYDDWIFGGNMEILTKLYSFNNTLRAINLYFIEFVHFPPIGIFDPIIVFFIKSQFDVSSITIDGIKFFDDTPHDFGFASYESGGVDNNKSYFYINQANKVEFNHYTDQNNIKEFIQMEFVVGGVSTDSSAAKFSTSKSRNAFGFFRVNYISTSSVFEIPHIRKTTTSLLPNNKSIISYIILITDNNDNTISGLTSGSISNFSLLFTDDIITEVVILSLLGVLIPLIIIIIPSLAFRAKFGNFVLAPFFLLMSIICIIGGIIPTWLFFIIVLSLSLFIFQKNEVENNSF